MFNRKKVKDLERRIERLERGIVAGHEDTYHPWVGSYAEPVYMPTSTAVLLLAMRLGVDFEQVKAVPATFALRPVVKPKRK
jgi:hypothetical protein